MIGLDTNILARYYIDDDADAESAKQRPLARRLVESGEELMVCKTVLLEFEWVMRGYYGFRREEVLQVFRHMLSLSQLRMEDRQIVESALLGLAEGLDFADALHHASYRECDQIASFDDRKFAGRVKRLGMAPGVVVPA